MPSRGQQLAHCANLRYVRDSQPGIRRKRWGRGFTYFDCDGERITDATERQRFNALKIPPAWTEVWICSDPRGHLLATGRDHKGRKQYLYHPDWRQIRSQAKFDRMLAFGNVLPKLRRAVQADLKMQCMSRTKVIATVVYLLERTLIRVGNEDYAARNQSYGLTTLRDRHLSIVGEEICFQFQGKSGVDHEIELTDSKLASILKRCQELPGQELFQYRDSDGDLQAIDSGDINDYLHDKIGDRFSAKDFRTWFGTVRALQSLIEQEQTTPLKILDLPESDLKTMREERIRQAIQQTAAHLGNRPATCKKYYIHPRILLMYEKGTLCDRGDDLMTGKPDLNSLEQWIRARFHELRAA